jgi:hypothetical protein
MFARISEARERFIFEEHRPEGVPKFARGMRGEGWDLLRAHDRDQNLEAVFAAVTPAMISARLGQLSLEGRLPALDPAARQDPQKSTISIVRSFTWASHFLGVDPPAIYLHDDAAVGLASLIAEEPTAHRRRARAARALAGAARVPRRAAPRLPRGLSPDPPLLPVDRGALGVLPRGGEAGDPRAARCPRPRAPR